jgi:hypothetical protein
MDNTVFEGRSDTDERIPLLDDEIEVDGATQERVQDRIRAAPEEPLFRGSHRFEEALAGQLFEAWHKGKPQKVT